MSCGRDLLLTHQAVQSDWKQGCGSSQAARSTDGRHTKAWPETRHQVQGGGKEGPGGDADASPGAPSPNGREMAGLADRALVWADAHARQISRPVWRDRALLTMPSGYGPSRLGMPAETRSTERGGNVGGNRAVREQPMDAVSGATRPERLASFCKKKRDSMRR